MSNIKSPEYFGIVAHQCGYASTSKSLATLHWIPINKWRIDFKIATISYKFLSTVQPGQLNLFTCPGRSLRSSDSGSLYDPRTKLLTGEHAFRSAAPSVWNRHQLTSETLCQFNYSVINKKHFFLLGFN